MSDPRPPSSVRVVAPDVDTSNLSPPRPPTSFSTKNPRAVTRLVRSVAPVMSWPLNVATRNVRAAVTSGNRKASRPPASLTWSSPQPSANR